MALQLIPIAVASVLGLGLGKGLFQSSSGTTKKEMKIGGEYHAPYEQYAPVQTYAPQIQYPDYQIQIDSPLARQSMTKKQISEPEIAGGASAGLDIPFVPLALLGVAGLIVYGVVSKK